MKEFKGTPGPWVASTTDRSIGPVSRDDDQSYGMIFPIAWVEFDGNQEYQQANANLIAAAPELLEALQFIINDCSRMIPKCAEDKANAAINKALGETK
ncbi:hypothetical protein LOH90_004331 [Salmonella enterica]|nr:hypothetical protein [Salmonella enterica]